MDVGSWLGVGLNIDRVEYGSEGAECVGYEEE